MVGGLDWEGINVTLQYLCSYAATYRRKKNKIKRKGGRKDEENDESFLLEIIDGTAHARKVSFAEFFAVRIRTHTNTRDARPENGTRSRSQCCALREGPRQ